MAKYSPLKLAFKVFEPAVKGDDSDLILIHGITSSKETWDDIVQNLADQSKRRAYALDMRNHGDSAWTDEYSATIMAEDVAHFMDEHSIKSATFIEHSMGALISMILALTKPEKVNAMIFEDIGPKMPPSTIREQVVLVIDMVKDGLPAITPDMDFETGILKLMDEIKKQLPKDFQTSPEHHEKFVAQIKSLLVNKGGKLEMKMNAAVIKAFLLDKERYEDTGVQGVCEKPTLFLYGTVSPFKVIDTKDYILKHFPKTTFQAIEGATHHIHVEYPEEYKEKILQFLNN